LVSHIFIVEKEKREESGERKGERKRREEKERGKGERRKEEMGDL